MHQVEQRSNEHEGELEGFGDAGEERSKSTGHHERADCLLALGVSAHPHCKGCARKTEHHDREEATLVATNFADDIADAVCPGAGAGCCVGCSCGSFEGLGTTEEVTNVVDADNVEPEDRVQSVVQAGRDQQAVSEAVEAGAKSTHRFDRLTEAEQCVVNQRPEEVENRSKNDREERSEDWDQTATREECEEVWQLRCVEAVVHPSGKNTDQDTDQDVLVVDGAPAL